MAIAVDATSKHGTQPLGTSPGTWSHTCTGSNLLLVVGIFCSNDSADLVTEVTYNSVALTRINTLANNGRVYLYALAGPTTGANTVSVSWTGVSKNHNLGAVSYTDVSQSGIPDSSNTGGVTGTSLTVSTTTVADNSWLVGMFANDGGTYSVGSGTVERITYDTTNRTLIDSGGAKSPAGSYSLIMSNSTSNQLIMAMMSFAPVAVATVGKRAANIILTKVG